MIENFKFEAFVFIGSIIEEIFPPLPSPLFIIITKIARLTQSYSLLYLFIISVIAALGKTLGALFLYILGDKGEKFVISRFGKCFNISHIDVENISTRLNKGIKDAIILLVFRVVPIIPTTPISLVCGIIKIDFYTFLITTFFGFIIRIMVIFYIGSKALRSINDNVNNAFNIIFFLLLFLLIGVVVWRYIKRKK